MLAATLTHGEVPAEEGAVPRRGRRQRRDDRARDLRQHADVRQLPRLAAEEELAERQDHLRQDHHGQGLTIVHFSGQPEPVPDTNYALDTP